MATGGGTSQPVVISAVDETSRKQAGGTSKPVVVTGFTIPVQNALMSEIVNDIGDFGGGSQDIDLDLGTVAKATISTGACTFTFSNPPASGRVGSLTLVLTNGGSQTVNWPASVLWDSGAAPALTAAGVDVLVFFTVDGGVSWYGFMSGSDMS